MKIIIPLLLFITSSLCDELSWNSLNDRQKANLLDIYHQVDDRTMKAVLIAISFHESRLGLSNLNLKDPSCGIMHIYLKTYFSKYKIKDNLHNRNYYCTRLIDENARSIKEAEWLMETYLKHWRGDYGKAIQSYNGGYKIRTKRTQKYLKAIETHIDSAITIVKALDKTEEAKRHKQNESDKEYFALEFY